MKIVLDTNILIDGSSDDHNYGNRIIDEVIAGRLQAFANKQTLAENRLLARRKVEDEYKDKLQTFFGAIQPSPSEWEGELPEIEDPEDEKILASALAVSADYLITSDKHLLVLEEYEGVRIVPPAQFWSIYEQETGKGWSNWLKDFIVDK